MTVDLAGEVLAALRSPEGQAALAEAIRPVVAEVVREALAEREADRLLDAPALARYLGCSPAALRMRLHRGSALAQLALTVDGRRVWRRSDVEAMLRRAGEGPRLRAVGGGR